MNEIIIGITCVHALCFVIVLFVSWADLLTELAQRPTSVTFVVLFSLFLMSPLLVASATVRKRFGYLRRVFGYLRRVFVPILVSIIKKTIRGKS